jgi:RNA polymerase sigma-70 factor, ECF subfamily
VHQVEQIVKECKKYNKFAQKLLYDLYSPLMTGICLRYIGDLHATKDVVQEGFIKVFTSIDKFKGNGSFEGWMKRIFINTSISYLRKQASKHKHLRIDDIDECNIDSDIAHGDKYLDLDVNPSDGTANFEMVLSADFSEDELVEILELVPEKYRLIFNLYCIEEYKHEEIASILGIEVSTSRTRLKRARIIIQKELYKMSMEKLCN